MDTIARYYKWAIYTRLPGQQLVREWQLNQIHRIMEVRAKAGDSSGLDTWDFVDWYFDGDQSWTCAKSAAILALKRDIVAGSINSVVVYELSQFSSDIREILDLVAFFDYYDVHLYAVQDQIDTSTPVGKSILQVMLTLFRLSKYYRPSAHTKSVGKVQ